MSFDTARKFPVPPDDAKTVMVAAGALVQALTAIDAVIADGEAAREDAATGPGFPSLPEPDEALLEAGAIRAATLEQARALKRDLAYLLADAESVWLEDRPAIPFVSVEPPTSEPAPRLLNGISVEPFDVVRYLVTLEAWYGRQIAHHLRAASAAARKLTQLLPNSDEESASLVAALYAFIRRVHGSAPDDPG